MPKNNVTLFSEKLGLKFNDVSILEEALTHRSFINEIKDENQKHNERMEFLGDAVLELIISEHLFTKYHDHPEGDLTSFRAAIVKTETLASVSRDLGVGEFLRMSKGEETTGGRDKDYLLANAFEAILGALYLDKGIDAAKEFVFKYLEPRLNHIIENRLDIDPKTKFQEISQNLFRVTPTYVLIRDEGPDHEKIFTMAVMVGKDEYGRGEGASKQKAEEQAASDALNTLHKKQKIGNIA